MENPLIAAETVRKASLSNLHTHEATGSSPVVSTKNHRNHLIPVIFFYNLQLFMTLNFRRFIKTHTLTHMVSTCVPMNITRVIPVIFFRDPQLFEVLNFWRFFKTHTLTHTGKGPESTGQGQTGIFLSGPVFLPHLLADDPTDGVCGVLLHLCRGVGVRVIMYPKSLQRTIFMIRDFARRQLSCSARSGFLAFPGGATL